MIKFEEFKEVIDEHMEFELDEIYLRYLYSFLIRNKAISSYVYGLSSYPFSSKRRIREVSDMYTLINCFKWAGKATEALVKETDNHSIRWIEIEDLWIKHFKKIKKRNSIVEQ